jgi:hypothetical protein
VQKIALAAWAILFAAGLIWIAFRSASERRLNSLYHSAAIGDMQSLMALSKTAGRDATQRIEAVGQNGVAPGIRVAALQVLSQRKDAHSGSVAPLMALEQPFEIRHAAITFFAQRGCDDICRSAAIYFLGALWGGTVPLEQTLAAKVPPEFQAQAAADARRLQADTEAGYLALLDQDPCESRRQLKITYSRSEDRSFIEDVAGKLHPCSRSR